MNDGGVRSWAYLLALSDSMFTGVWSKLTHEQQREMPLEMRAQCVGRYEQLTRHEPTVGDEGETALRLRRASGITPVAYRWLWRHHLARGKFHLMAGPPGAGKTTIALAIAATVTRKNGRWPDGTRTEGALNVVIWSGEDDQDDTLVPRLAAMGADLDRVYFVDDVLADGKSRPFDPSRDMAALELRVREVGEVGLLILDPVVNAVAGDSHKNTEVRRSLQPVADLLRGGDAVGLGVSHFSKGSAGRDPVERVTGSVAFGALPRVVFAAAKTVDDEGAIRRLFVRAKSNIGPDGGGFNFDLEEVELDGYPGVMVSRLLWAGALQGTARELLAAAEAVDQPGERGANDEAHDWLRSMLEAGPMRASEVQKQAKAAGVHEKALRRAREKLGVKPRKREFSGGWEWALPTKMPQSPHSKNMGTLGTLGTFDTSQDAQEDQDDLNTGSGGKGILGAEPCSRCNGEGCGWCQ